MYRGGSRAFGGSFKRTFSAGSQGARSASARSEFGGSGARFFTSSSGSAKSQTFGGAKSKSDPFSSSSSSSKRSFFTKPAAPAQHESTRCQRAQISIASGLSKGYVCHPFSAAAVLLAWPSPPPSDFLELCPCQRLTKSCRIPQCPPLVHRGAVSPGPPLPVHRERGYVSLSLLLFDHVTLHTGGALSARSVVPSLTSCSPVSAARGLRMCVC